MLLMYILSGKFVFLFLFLCIIETVQYAVSEIQHK